MTQAKAARAPKKPPVITIDDRYCKGCGLCVHACPKKALVFGKERSRLGYFMPAVVAGENCVGCKHCEIYCPDMVIRVDD